MLLLFVLWLYTKWSVTEYSRIFYEKRWWDLEIIRRKIKSSRSLMSDANILTIESLNMTCDLFKSLGRGNYQHYCSYWWQNLNYCQFGDRIENYRLVKPKPYCGRAAIDDAEKYSDNFQKCIRNIRLFV